MIIIKPILSRLIDLINIINLEGTSCVNIDNIKNDLASLSLILQMCRTNGHIYWGCYEVS